LIPWPGYCAFGLVHFELEPLGQEPGDAGLDTFSGFPIAFVNVADIGATNESVASFSSPWSSWSSSKLAKREDKTP